VQSHPPPPHESLPFNLQGIRALVVDDHATNRLILRETLSSWGAMVTDAASGRAALGEWRRAYNSSKPYHLLLLDCRMPEMDGFQVAETIRQAHPSLSLTTVMMASHHWADDIAHTYDMGLSGYLIKPIRKSDLRETLAIAIERNAGNQPATAGPAKTPNASSRTKPLHILLVEDSLDNQLLIRSYLKHTPCHLDIADHGAIALEQFKNGNYDLILMDMQMPVMDGYDATRAIRAWEQEQALPATQVIALTAQALKEDGIRIFEAGCNAHMTKPIRKHTLLEVIRVCQERRSS
ncbi:MAG: response regulator, partial [Nitrospira sp.]|nr:response regulator [Nitrospira sp.]